MRTSKILLTLLLLSSPLSAQAIAASPSLHGGDTIRVKWRGDTTWHESSVAWMDRAGEVCLGAKLPPPDPADDGFIVRLFSAATAIAVRGARADWVELPEPELRAIQGCGTGRAPPHDARCGTEPQLAKMSVAGAIYGARMNAGSGGPWAEFLSLPNEDLSPLTVGERCEAVLRAATGPRAAPDSLPLHGIIGLGALGFAVVRGTPPTGAGGRITTAITLLGPELQVLSGWQSTY